MKQCKNCNVTKNSVFFGLYRDQFTNDQKVKNVCKKCIAEEAKARRTFKIPKEDFKEGEYDPDEHWFEDDPRAVRENDVGKASHAPTHLPRAWIDNA
jgi:hypothetical protein